MNPIIVTILIAAAVAFLIRYILYRIDNTMRSIFRKNIVRMNREVAKHPEIHGWLVMIDIKKRIVGLYEDGHSVSHDKIYLGKDVANDVLKDMCQHEDDTNCKNYTIGDFKTLDVDIPRMSYRVLYEYQVPLSTPVIFY